jgi:hypothetical protein
MDTWTDERGFRCAAVEARGMRYVLRELNAGEAMRLQAIEDDARRGLAAVALAVYQGEAEQDLEACTRRLELLPASVFRALSDAFAELQGSEGEPGN